MYFFKYPTCIRSYLEIASYCLKKNIVYKDADDNKRPSGRGEAWGLIPEQHRIIRCFSSIVSFQGSLLQGEYNNSYCSSAANR